MTVVGIDDTDSATEGMCTTYVGTRIKEEIEQAGFSVSKTCLTRLCPAVKRKTRGNAAVSIHTECPLMTAHRIASEVVSRYSVTGEDENTNPGVVTVDIPTGNALTEAVEFTKSAIKRRVTKTDAGEVREELDAAGFSCKTSSFGDGNGLIGATAAIAGFAATTEASHECISYRQPDKWGTQRQVDTESVFTAARNHYPDIWDTVDTSEKEVVAAPHTPCPILYAIRGESPQAVEKSSAEITSEPVSSRTTFYTNQGTDMHLTDSQINETRNGRGYTIECRVTDDPHTEKGGHVVFEVADETGTCSCIAFEPTKQFRDYVRNLRVGDDVTVCGEMSDGTIKLEKLKVRSLDKTKQTNPVCEDCGRSAQSEGKNKGYSCPDCGQFFETKATVRVDRDLSTGWYEVPPFARRHLAKPLVRGGFDGIVYPER